MSKNHQPAHGVFTPYANRCLASLVLGSVAEGVKPQGQTAIPMSFGCQVGQGYLSSRPLAVDDATRWLVELDGRLPAPAG